MSNITFQIVLGIFRTGNAVSAQVYFFAIVDSSHTTFGVINAGSVTKGILFVVLLLTGLEFRRVESDPAASCVEMSCITICLGNRT